MPRRRGSKKVWPVQRQGAKPSKGPSVLSGGEYRSGVVSGSVANPIMRVRQLPLFGLRTRRGVTYYSSVTLAGAAGGAVTSYIFSANGIFDPDVSFGGHQPMGFDQMMVFYNHYTVLKSRIKIIYQNTSTITARVGLSVSGSTSVSSDFQVNVENGEIIVGTAQPDKTFGSTGSLQQSVDCGKFQGLQNTMDDPNMRGDSASNPSEQLYYILSLWAPVGAAPSVEFDVLIEYDTVFHEPRKGTLS